MTSRLLSLPVIFILLALGSWGLESKAQGLYELKASSSRTDGVALQITPGYPHRGDIFVTMNPELCLAPGQFVPFDDPLGYIHVAWINERWSDPEGESVQFHSAAPAGIELCYLLVGRGVVEAVAWGSRRAEWEEEEERLTPPEELVLPERLNPLEHVMTASSDREDGIEIRLVPPFHDFSSLYLTPEEDNSCPNVGEPFNREGRWMRVTDTFNGRYFLDRNAPIAIELCYFMISRRTGLTVARAVGYREP